MTLAQYTKESLDKLLKRDLISIILSFEEENRSLQSRMFEVNNEVVEEMRKFNENFSKLQSELSIAKRVNTELTKRIVTLQRQCWANDQCSRKECVEVVGIPRQLDDKHLEAKVLSIFQKVGWTIAPEFTDDCHQLGKNNDRVIVKFTRRKDCKQVLQVKKDLKDLTVDDFDLSQGTKKIVNQSLCPYYRILWSKAKRLQSMGKINNFFISGGTVKVKIDENSKPLAITHLDDLAINFPGADLSASPKISYWRTNRSCVQLLYYIV